MTHPADPLHWAITAFSDGRNATYQRFEDYLAGDQPLEFATEKFRSAFGQQFRAFAYNRCRSVIDAHADRLQVAGFAANDVSVAEAAKELWDDNQMGVREGHVYADQFGDGDAYVIADVHPVTGKVQYWTQNPKVIRVHWDDEQPNSIDLAAKSWMTDDKHVRVNLYFANRIEKFVSRLPAQDGMPARTDMFEPYQPEGEPWPVPLPVTDTVPVFHFANNGRTNQYGTSELQSILPLQDAINKSLMDLLVAMELAAFPQRVLIGLDKPETEEEKKAVARFESGLTRIYALEDPNASVAEFTAVNIAQYISVVEWADKGISRVSRVPVHYLEMSGDFPSGRAMRLAETPFTKKIADRQRANGSTWADVQRYGLRCLGMDVPAGTIRVNWTSAEATADEDTWDLIREKTDAGMPLVSALREAGYDPKQIATIVEESKDDINVIGDYAGPDEIPADTEDETGKEAA